MNFLSLLLFSIIFHWSWFRKRSLFLRYSFFLLISFKILSSKIYFSSDYSSIYCSLWFFIFYFLIKRKYSLPSFAHYYLTIYYKEKIFFDIFRFHTLFTLISVLFITLLWFFIPLWPLGLIILLSIFWIWAATFFLSVQTDENPVFIYIYLLGGLSFIFQLLQWFFWYISYFLLVVVYVIGSLLAFELSPKINLYKPYSIPIRYFSLFLIITLTPVLYYTTFSFLSESIFILSILLFFFFSLHTRYGNQVAYILGLLTVYFIYSVLFFWLLQSGSISSVLLFLFFLPLVLIGMTYFIEESHEYDFLMLHYSAIGFSILFSFYTLFFIGWGGDLLFLVSFCIFWVALLFFMSYLYFYNHQKVK